MFLITISDLQLKHITVQEDHNIHTHFLFCLVVLAVENWKKPLLLVTYRNQIFLYFHFKLISKNQKKTKTKQKKDFPHFPLILHEV